MPPSTAHAVPAGRHRGGNDANDERGRVGVPGKEADRGDQGVPDAAVLGWESDAETLTAALDRYLAAFPSVRRPLGITGGPGAPDPEALRRAAREVVMVRISLVGETVKGTMS